MLVSEYRQIFVTGEVKKPGGYSYQEGLTVESPEVTIATLASENNLVPRDVYTMVARAYPEAATAMPVMAAPPAV